MELKCANCKAGPESLMVIDGNQYKPDDDLIEYMECNELFVRKYLKRCKDGKPTKI